MKICTEAGCERANYARGVCTLHYQRHWAAGTLPDRATAHERFDAKTEAAGDCLIWTGYCNEKGYGKFKHKDKIRTATHVVWEWAYGPIPDGQTIDHTCHNRSCVLLDHLRLATMKQQGENVLGANSRSKSGIRGVHNQGGRWIAQVTHNGVNNYLGSFDTAEEAGEVARLKRLELFTHNDLDRLVA